MHYKPKHGNPECPGYEYLTPTEERELKDMTKGFSTKDNRLYTVPTGEYSLKVLIRPNRPILISHSDPEISKGIKFSIQDGFCKYTGIPYDKWGGYVHALVAYAVHGPKPAGSKYHFIDGNKLNVHPSNIEYIKDLTIPNLSAILRL